MENLNIEQVNEVYELLNISYDDNTNNLNYSASTQNSESAPFGIYTEGGFNYSNNTKAK